MNVSDLKRMASEYELRGKYDLACATYEEILQRAARNHEDVDVQLYNQLGDLHARLGQTDAAIRRYEQAANLYVEKGALNNALAIFKKILRYSPHRTSVYYDLGRITARKGLASDARLYLLEFADRKQSEGDLDQALRGLYEYAYLSPRPAQVLEIIESLPRLESDGNTVLIDAQGIYKSVIDERRRFEESGDTSYQAPAPGSTLLPEQAASSKETEPSGPELYEAASAEEQMPWQSALESGVWVAEIRRLEEQHASASAHGDPDVLTEVDRCEPLATELTNFAVAPCLDESNHVEPSEEFAELAFSPMVDDATEGDLSEPSAEPESRPAEPIFSPGVDERESRDLDSSDLIHQVFGCVLTAGESNEVVAPVESSPVEEREVLETRGRGQDSSTPLREEPVSLDPNTHAVEEMVAEPPNETVAFNAEEAVADRSEANAPAGPDSQQTAPPRPNVEAPPPVQTDASPYVPAYCEQWYEVETYDLPNEGGTAMEDRAVLGRIFYPVEMIPPRTPASPLVTARRPGEDYPSPQQCRAMLRELAHMLVPQTSHNGRKTGHDHVGRINGYLLTHCSSVEHAERLGRAVADLDIRLTSAIARLNGSPTADDSRALLTQTYVTLGDVLASTIRDRPHSEVGGLRSAC